MGLLFIALADFPSYSPGQVLENGFPMVRLIRMGNNYWTVLNNLSGYEGREHSPRPGYLHSSSSPKSPSGSISPVTPDATMTSSTSTSYDLDQWPKRRAVFHAREWLEWLGCELGEPPEHQEFCFA